MYRYLFIVVLILFAIPAHATDNSVNITLETRQAEPWQLTYRTTQPVSRLTFVRNPDNSRSKRWQTNNDFVVVSDKGTESIVRLDGQPFNAVTLSVSPDYFPLPKEYAPFSPFSDGSMLFHSGRFFACAEICRAQRYAWKFTLIAADSDNIIVGGRVFKGKAQWLDGGNGQKIYVGSAQPVSEGAFVSVIDNKLPDKLHNSIHSSMPGLIAFFRDKLGALTYRPTLFASYSRSVNGGYGNQGGTLPGQIFMHWYGNKAIQPFNSQATYWFFAHEMAHLFQGDASLTSKPQEAWLHEGAADLFAGLASEEDYYYKRLKKAQKQCQKGLKEDVSFSQRVMKNPYLHYSCGLVIFDAIHTDLIRQDRISVFTLWQHYNTAISQGAPASAATFIRVSAAHISADLTGVLNDFVASDHLDIVRLVAFNGAAPSQPGQTNTEDVLD